MPQSITIPASFDEAKAALSDLGELITARKWERAAIVAAFVRVSPGRGQQHPDIAARGNRQVPISPAEFAEIGIVGLLDNKAVTRYVLAWLHRDCDFADSETLTAHDANCDVEHRYPRPGATRRLPTSKFPPTRTGTDGRSTVGGAGNTVSEILDTHDVEEVIDQLTDEQVENLTAAATERRPEAAQRGRTRPTRQRAAAGSSMPSGGGTRIVDMPGVPDTTWMDIEREIGRVHSAIVLLAGWNTTHPEAMGARADELAREHELFGMVVDGARGLTQADMDEMTGRSS